MGDADEIPHPTGGKDFPDDMLEFRSEAASPAESEIPSPLWRVLAVDDDRDFQRTMAFALRGVRILERSLVLTQAFSMAEASTLLAAERDFGVILLDVVMETDDAGLRLVKAVREILGNAEVRIVLLTGQPGLAPVGNVMTDYDINEYCTKSELTTSRLMSILTGELRAYDQLKTISTARRGLQLIVESSNRLLDKRELTAYCDAALTEVALLLGVDPEGVVCARVDQLNADNESADSPHKAIIVGAAGRLRAFIGRGVDSLPDSSVAAALRLAIRARANIEADDATTLFFPQESSGADFVIYLPTSRTLQETERQLLRVFATNISGGLHNVALFSRLDRLAYVDPLLGLPNKNALVRAIDHGLQTEGKSDLILLIVDLDQFSDANHSFGVAFGDALLHQFSKRVSMALTPPAFLARISDDLFGILGPRETVSEAIVKAALAEPFDLSGTTYRMTACSILMPLGAVAGSARDAIRLGRLAMKEAKRKGQGSTVIYEKGLEDVAIKRFHLLHQLQRGLDAKELFLVYQPKTELRSGRVVGVEALLRWNCAGEMIPPDRFIPIAEESTLIHRIGLNVLEEACDAIDALEAAGAPRLTFSINVSGRQFSDPTLMASILGVLGNRGISPQRIELEITETVAMASFDVVSTALRDFRAAGGTIAIDDFGSGYSSLKYLNELPADVLKIDQAFVSIIDGREESGSIAEMVIHLARALGLRVIAEGVETAVQARWLLGHDCDLAQGWFYGRPMPVPILIDWLRERRA